MHFSRLRWRIFRANLGHSCSQRKGTYGTKQLMPLSTGTQKQGFRHLPYLVQEVIFDQLTLRNWPSLFLFLCCMAVLLKSGTGKKVIRNHSESLVSQHTQFLPLSFLHLITLTVLRVTSRKNTYQGQILCFSVLAHCYQSG